MNNILFLIKRVKILQNIDESVENKIMERTFRRFDHVQIVERMDEKWVIGNDVRNNRLSLCTTSTAGDKRNTHFAPALDPRFDCGKQKTKYL